MLAIKPVKIIKNIEIKFIKTKYNKIKNVNFYLSPRIISIYINFINFARRLLMS